MLDPIKKQEAQEQLRTHEIREVEINMSRLMKASNITGCDLCAFKVPDMFICKKLTGCRSLDDGTNFQLNDDNNVIYWVKKEDVLLRNQQV